MRAHITGAVAAIDKSRGNHARPISGRCDHLDLTITPTQTSTDVRLANPVICQTCNFINKGQGTVVKPPNAQRLGQMGAVDIPDFDRPSRSKSAAPIGASQRFVRPM